MNFLYEWVGAMHFQKSTVIPHSDAESVGSWQDIKQELRSEMVLKVGQIPRRGAE